MTYSTSTVVNNILSRSFFDKIYINPMKLQRILFFTVSDYQKFTGDYMLREPFLTWSYGGVAYSVYDRFQALGSATIQRYARDAHDASLCISEYEDPYLRLSLDRIWEATKNHKSTELSRIAQQEDSAWDKAFQRGDYCLSCAEIGTDNTFYQPLGLTQPLQV